MRRKRRNHLPGFKASIGVFQGSEPRIYPNIFPISLVEPRFYNACDFPQKTARASMVIEDQII